MSMESTFGGLSMAMRALMAQQTAVDVTNHNVGNASTEGYSRQQVDFTEASPYTVAALDRPQQAGQLGQGVEVADIQRARDEFIDQQWRGQSSVLADAQAQHDAIQQVESIYNEPSDTGLNAQLGQFWNAWRNLANHPEDASQRTALIQTSSTLAQSLKLTRSQLVTQQHELDSQVAAQVGQINGDAQQIARLNQQIATAEGVGDHPNDLLDQRDALLDKLSGLANVSYVTDAHGQDVVTIGGSVLVAGNQSYALQAVADPTNNNLQKVVWQSDGSAAVLSGGSLKGVLDSRDQTVGGQINQLDTLAGTLITQVNAVVQGGYALDNSTGTNVQFFTGTTAQDIAVSSAVVNNPNLVAAAQNPNAPGDGSNALAVANLQNALVLNGGSASIDDYYQGMISGLGAAGQQQASLVTSQTTLVGDLTTQRQQVSGVSLDEESANLIKFQQSYQAAARMVTAVDQLLDQVINHMGMVGL